MIRKRVQFSQQKYSHIKSRSKRSKLDGRGQFNFVNKDDPNYQKPYGTDYSEKQRKLLSGEVAWETTRLNEITRLLNKAVAFKDEEAIKKAQELRTLKVKQIENKYVPDLTVDEAKEILRSLTPWLSDNKR